MNWEALGAIGEILGAFGVILTLAYLARQIRESNQAVRQAAMQEVLSLNSQLLSQLGTDNELAALWIRGCADSGDLPDSERVQYRAQLMQLALLWERCYFLHESGNLDEWIWDDVRNGLRATMLSAGFQSWFEDTKHRLNDQWRSHIIQELSTSSGDYAPFGIGQRDE